MGIKYASLFSGIGGFEKGIDQASKIVGVNAECVFASEIDKFAQQTYTKHFGSEYLHGDITKIDGGSVPDIDMLVGGFPCQSFSIAGKRLGFGDCRGTLFFDIARILNCKKPKVVLLENVKGLLNHDGGNTFRTILTTLDELGYDAEWQVLNSKNHRVPQNRERVFIVGHLRGHCRGQVFPLGEANSIHNEFGTDTEKVREIASTLMAKSYSSWVGNYVVHSLYPRSSKTRKGGTGHLCKSTGTTYCLDTGNNQAIEQDSRIRKLTPIECERLQGFPDNWTELGVSHKYDVLLFGNIWNKLNVQSKDVRDASSLGNPSCALCITKDGGSGGIHQPPTQIHTQTVVNAVLTGAIEVVTAEKCVCDITNHGNDMVMLYSQKETQLIGEITKPNHIFEKMEWKSTCQLLKITLEENLSKEKLCTISTWIKEIISSQTFTCVKTGSPITAAILLYNASLPNLSKMDPLVLRTENTTEISNTQRYKQLGNSVTVNVIEAIMIKILSIYG